MSEELEKNNAKKFIPIVCPRCHNPLNIQSTREVGYDKLTAKWRTWCRFEQRWIYFSELDD